MRINYQRLKDLTGVALIEAEEALEELAARMTANPLEGYFPHKRQQIFHRFDSKVKCFFGGTQSGKTTGGLVDDLIQALPLESLPEHLRPYKHHTGPFKCRIMTESFGVLETVLYEKLRELCPARELSGGSWETAYNRDTKVLNFACGSRFFFACFRPDQRALLPDGTWKEVGSLDVGEEVQTRFGPRKVTATVAYPDAPMTRLRMRGGYEMISTPNHPHMTAEGSWRNTEDIRLGDRLMPYRPAPRGGLVDVAPTLEQWEVGWTAILIGDGCLRGRTPMFAAAEGSALLTELPSLPEGMHVRRQVNPGKVNGYDRVDTYFLVNDGGKTAKKGNAVKDLMERFGLWDVLAPNKFIPDEIFRQPFESRCAFLRYLWATDGTINRKIRSATYATSSYRLAFDVKYLLRSVGIWATITEVRQRSGYGNECRYAVALSGAQIGTFHRLIGRAGESREEVDNGTSKHTAGTVFSIEDAGVGEVCCVEVEEVHELIVDGIVTSNTYEQDPRKQGGWTGDRVHYDEEPPIEHRTEGKFRVMRYDGDEIFTMTPVQGMTWMYDTFWEPAEHAGGADGVYHLDGVDIVTVDIDDNPAISDDAKRVALEGLSAEQLKARKSGAFVAMHGMIYPEFTNDHIVPELEELPENVNVVIGIDPGMRNRCAVVWAYVDNADRMVIFDEGYYQGHTIAEVCREIHVTNTRWKRTPIYYVIDPAARNLNHQTGRSDQMEYADHGVVAIAGQNAVRPGINRVKERLEREGGFEITANCKSLVSEFRKYRWKKPPRTGEDGKEEPVKRDDHAVDCLRYIVMSRPYLPLAPDAKPESQFERALREDRERREGAGHGTGLVGHAA